MLQHGSADDIFCALKVAEADARRANEEARAADRRVSELHAAYMRTRPLTEAERDMLAAHVEAGGALCCAVGRAWLEERLPEPWARAINGWAYEALGCRPAYGAKDRARFVQRVRELELDRLPRGAE